MAVTGREYFNVFYSSSSSLSSLAFQLSLFSALTRANVIINSMPPRIENAKNKT